MALNKITIRNGMNLILQGCNDFINIFGNLEGIYKYRIYNSQGQSFALAYSTFK